MAEVTPLHKHEHPVYQWIALFASVAIILSLAGWYALTYQASVEDDALAAVESAYSATLHKSAKTTKSTTATTSTTGSEIDAQVSAINGEINSVSSDDFSENKLDNTSLGL